MCLQESTKISSLDLTGYAWGLMMTEAEQVQYDAILKNKQLMTSKFGTDPGLMAQQAADSGLDVDNEQSQEMMSFLFGAGDDNLIRIWEASSGRLLASIATEAKTIACLKLAEKIDGEMERFRPIKTIMAVGEQLEMGSLVKVELYDWRARQKIFSFDSVHLYAANSLAFLCFTPLNMIGKEILLFTSTNNPADQGLKVWNLNTMARVTEYSKYSACWHSLNSGLIPAVNPVAPTVYGAFGNGADSFRIIFFTVSKSE
jgi:WD40 repeat protein